MKVEHYGLIENVVGNEGEGLGTLFIVALLDPSESLPAARILVGSPAASEVDLAQYTLSTEQAKAMIAMLAKACADIEAAARKDQP